MISWTLLVMAAGYFVFSHASAQKGDVKTVGRIVGLIILVASLVGLVCNTACKSSMMSCGAHGARMTKSFCPMPMK